MVKEDDLGICHETGINKNDLGCLVDSDARLPTQRVTAVTAVTTVTADTSVTSAPLSRQSRWTRRTRRRRIRLEALARSESAARFQHRFGVESESSHHPTGNRRRVLNPLEGP